MRTLYRCPRSTYFGFRGVGIRLACNVAGMTPESGNGGWSDVAPPCTPGLATVVRLASAAPAAFSAWTRMNMADVEEFPVGTEVLVLPARTEDHGWAAVVVADIHADGAFFCYMHPQVLEPVHVHKTAKVGMVDRRTWKEATHPHLSYPHQPGPRLADGEWVLDCRWPDPPTVDAVHSGWCLPVAVETASTPHRVADVITFGHRLSNATQDHGTIFCKHAKHRSVSGALLLREFCNIAIDFKDAVRDRHEQCCGLSTVQHKAIVATTLRNLGPLERSKRLLYDALHEE